MMAANYRHIGGGENRLGRHYSRFSAFWPPQPLPVNHLLCENCRTQGRIGEVGLASGQSRRCGYSVSLTCGSARPAAVSSAMICCRYSMPSRVRAAIDPKAAILREHVARKVEEPVFVLAEQVGDVGDREDGADGRQAQAA